MNDLILSSFHKELEKIAVVREVLLASKLPGFRHNRRLRKAAKYLAGKEQSVVSSLTKDRGGPVPTVIPKKHQEFLARFVTDPVGTGVSIGAGAAAPGANIAGSVYSLGREKAISKLSIPEDRLARMIAADKKQAKILRTRKALEGGRQFSRPAPRRHSGAAKKAGRS